ncbi:hypothetical protein FRC04_002784 [Tulasnella sp. 424]|nr:hypothetical protein FRC04_002784 [Tulasnella sp. 424]
MPAGSSATIAIPRARSIHRRTSKRESSGFILLLVTEIRLYFSEGHVTNTYAARDGVAAFVAGIAKTPVNFHDKRQCYPQPFMEQQRQRYVHAQYAFETGPNGGGPAAFTSLDTTFKPVKARSPSPFGSQQSTSPPPIRVKSKVSLLTVKALEVNGNNNGGRLRLRQ